MKSSNASSVARASALKQIDMDYGVFGPGWEKLTYPTYDYQIYPQAGAQQFNFFQIPQGQGGKTFDDTNMLLGGMFPRGQQFLVEGFEIDFRPAAAPGSVAIDSETQGAATNWNDTNSVYRNGSFKFTIGSKDYANIAPLNQLPPSYRLAGVAAVADTTTAAATNKTVIAYAAAAGQPFECVPFLIPENTNFNCQINYLNGAQSVSAAGRIGVVMNGLLLRKSQ